MFTAMKSFFQSTVLSKTFWSERYSYFVDHLHWLKLLEHMSVTYQSWRADNLKHRNNINVCDFVNIVRRSLVNMWFLWFLVFAAAFVVMTYIMGWVMVDYTLELLNSNHEANQIPFFDGIMSALWMIMNIVFVACALVFGGIGIQRIINRYTKDKVVKKPGFISLVGEVVESKMEKFCFNINLEKYRSK